MSTPQTTPPVAGPPGSAGELLLVDRLAYRYASGGWALAGVSFSLGFRERVGLVGPNGAGKTTLLLHLNGLLTGVHMPGEGPTPPDLTEAGRTNPSPVRVLGLSVSRSTAPEVRRIVGLMFQNPDDQLFCGTIGEDVAFGPRNLGLPPAEVQVRVSQSLAQVGLAGVEGKSPGELSFGAKRRACLAGVLACEPDLLALDEPSSNLDPRARRELIGLLGSLNSAQLIATHDLEMVLDLCPRTLILDQGRIAADGPSRHILADETLMARHGLEVPLSIRAGLR